MAKKNAGITLLSVAVAIAAFIVSTIWLENLKAKVETASSATKTWNTTSDTVRNSELAVEASANDIGNAKRHLEQKLQQIKELDDATVALIRTEALSTREIEDSIALTKRESVIHDRLGKAGSSGEVADLDNCATRLMSDMRGKGLLYELKVERYGDALKKKETLVKNIGYTLGILAIVVAGIAQLLGKS